MNMHSDPTRETLDRVRRIETRLTKVAQHFDIDVGGGRPVWDDGDVIIPSPNCSIREDYLMSITVDQ
jgi:hypothetical protein